VKKSLILISVLWLSVALMSQVRSGTIWGHISDSQGSPLPGVSVTLKSPYAGPITIVSDRQGIYRFPSLESGGQYALTAELQGFKKLEKTGIIVSLGSQSRTDLVLEQGKIEEKVTTVSVTPVVDAKKGWVGKTVTRDMLQSLPTARDPWNVIQMAPSVLLDRENVGGSEAGLRAGVTAKGDPTGGANNTWAIDGLVVTDPTAVGSSPGFWDFDSFEEMNIVTGGADVSVQTSGVAVNMVTRRGGNKISFGGRYYLTDHAFQANNLTDSLRSQGVTGINKINQIKDYGFNLSGPIIRDKAWLWLAYGVQDIDTVLLDGTSQKPLIKNYAAKLNLQPVATNRFEALWMANSAEYVGRDASSSFPGGYDQKSRFSLGNPIVKIQDEQMFGDNLLVSAKFGYTDSGTRLVPHSDPDLTALYTYDATADVSYGNSYTLTKRPAYSYGLHAQLYNDKLFGASHDIKMGVEYSTRRSITDSSAAGQLKLSYNLASPDIDPTGTGNPVFTPGMQRWTLASSNSSDFGVKHWSAYIQDTITTGRLSFQLGLRYDRQTPSIYASQYRTVDDSPVWDMFSSEVKEALLSFMPGLSVSNISPNYHWTNLSPRLGIVYDIFGNGRTVVKLSASMYGDYMGTDSVAYLFNAYGAPTSWGNAFTSFYWLDSTLNPGVVDAGEVFGYDPVTYAAIPLIVDGAVNEAFVDAGEFSQYSGFTPYSSTAQASAYTVAAGATSPKTREILFSVEHELKPNLSIGMNFTFRRYYHMSWDTPYYTNGLLGDYRVGGESWILGPSYSSVAGSIPDTLLGVDLGEGAGVNYYLLDSDWTGTPYYSHQLTSRSYTYTGLEFTISKRLSDKWMLDGSISYMHQKAKWGDAYVNETNFWALHNAEYAPYLGESAGRIGQYIFTPWTLKLEGLYQLPMDFNVSFTFNARAGHVVPHYMTIVDYTWDNTVYNSVVAYLDVFGRQRMATFYQLNLRLEKMFKLGNAGRLYLMADGFNILNSSIINRRYDRYEGTLYVYEDHTTFVPYVNNYKVNEIMNPFIARFGIRFQF